MQINHGFIGVLTWKIKNLSKNLFKIQMLLLIWLVQERKLNIELILNLLTLKLLKKSQRLVLKRVFTDSSTSQPPELMRIHNHSISKPKPSENKLSEKLSQMQLFSGLVQFTDWMIILPQISKDKLTFYGTTWFLSMMIVQQRSNQSEITILLNVC